jgi:hypothetical protein
VGFFVVCLLSCVRRAQGSTTTTTLPPLAQASDTIFVHWNLAPMMPGEFGELLTYAGLYHASVSFFNTRTDASSFVQFVAPSFGPALLFPNLSSNFSSECKDQKLWSSSLSWNNPGHVMFVDEVGTGYIWKHRTQVATINGTVYNSVHAWVQKAMATYKEYYLFHAITDQFKEYKGKNAGAGHGGIPLDDAKAPSGLSAEKCQARCTNDLRCDCATMNGSGKCFKRASCNPNSFANDSNHTTWTKIEVETGDQATTCMDFARLALTQIYNLAGPCVFDPHSDGILNDDPILHVRDQPSPIVSWDPAELGDFCRYYTRMDTISKGVTGGVHGLINGLAALLEELVVDRAILHHGDQYYRFRPVFPYASYRKRFVPLPGTGECGNTSGHLHPPRDASGEELVLV